MIQTLRGTLNKSIGPFLSYTRQLTNSSHQCNILCLDTLNSSSLFCFPLKYEYHFINQSSSRLYHRSSTAPYSRAVSDSVLIEKTIAPPSLEHLENHDNEKSSTCSQGVEASSESEEEEQEEMFVTADPMLGHGEIQEWGGPRRGGKLMEPTRFGDWERKGRCSDF